ncbi:hypothetical protein [Avibacterium avium]
MPRGGIEPPTRGFSNTGLSTSPLYTPKPTPWRVEKPPNKPNWQQWRA